MQQLFVNVVWLWLWLLQRCDHQCPWWSGSVKNTPDRWWSRDALNACIPARAKRANVAGWAQRCMGSCHSAIA